MAFEVIFTDKGLNDLRGSVAYIWDDLENPTAATKMYQDVLSTIKLIQDNPKSYPLCDDIDLANRGLRKIHLKKYKYKIFFSIHDDTVLIDAILHDKRDTKKALA